MIKLGYEIMIKLGYEIVIKHGYDIGTIFSTIF